MNPQIQTTLLLFTFCMFCVGTLMQIADNNYSSSLRISYRSLASADEIQPLQQPVRPIAYSSVVSLEKLPVKQKKQRFAELLLPAILISKKQLQIKRERIIMLVSKASRTTGEERWLAEQLSRYRAENYQQLIRRMPELPNSLILAQAAIETGWGSSRFFVQANNIFGVWSFDPKEPRIRAKQDRDGKAIYLKRYNSLLGSIDDYLLTLGRGQHYSALRAASVRNQNAFELTQYLSAYSEIGQAYTERLNSLIRHNNLQQYDNFSLATN